jgi:hypothetical protein
MKERVKGETGTECARRILAPHIAALTAVIVLCLVLSMPAVVAAGYQWTTTGGPPAGGNSVTCLALDSTHNILYAGAMTGEVYRYQNGAWSSTGGPSGQVMINDIEYDPVSNTLVAALYNNSTFEVWTYQEGGTWTLTSGGPGNVNPGSVASDGARQKLYACDYSGNMYVYDYQAQPSSWVLFGTPLDGSRCMVMDTDRNVLYAGGSNGTDWPPDAAVARYDGANWTPFGEMNMVHVSSMAFDSNRNILYAGLWTNQSGLVNVFRKNVAAGTDWAGIGTLCGGPEIFSLTVDEVNDTLYALAYDGHVYKNCDASAGSTWLDIGLVSVNTLYNRALQYDPASATLFCGSSDGTVYSQGISALTAINPPSGARGQMLDVALTATNSNFSDASQVVFSGDGVNVSSTTVLGPNKLRASIRIEPGTYLGPRNVLVKTGGDKANKLVGGFTVTEAAASSTWYLAEGTNAWGFSTYITIENPNDTAVSARLTYMDPSAPTSGTGILSTRVVSLPALSQTTVSSTADIGAVDFSTEVQCLDDKPIAVDRTMFWTGQGANSPGYHSSVGASTPADTWYLPEGSSAWGFETWTLLLNPGDAAANVTLTYMTESSGAKVVSRKIPAHARATYSMLADIGAADASTMVASDVPVVAERSVYRDSRREGSCSIGATTPAADYYLAEGATGYGVGFTTYVLVQNPGNDSNKVTLTYQTGSGEVAGPSFIMSPNSRHTVRVNDTLPSSTDVSTQVHGSKPLIAERAMYWDNGTGQAFHASVGLDAPHMAFMFPDGQTSQGFETWTLVANPNPGAVTVRITYLPQGGGTGATFTDEIPKASRRSYSMGDKLPSGRASILVESLDGARPILVERAMYMNNRGAGTDTIGGFSD